MADWLFALLIVAATMVVLYFGPRLLGMGKCMACGRGCAPWDAYCGRFHGEDGDR